MTTKILEQPSPFDTDGTYLYKIREYFDIPIKYILVYPEIRPAPIFSISYRGNIYERADYHISHLYEQNKTLIDIYTNVLQITDEISFKDFMIFIYVIMKGNNNNTSQII